MKLGLAGKRVLITGSSRGIGLATAKAFLQEGASVIINSRNEAVLCRIAEEHNKIDKDKLSYVCADINTEDGAEKVKSFVDDKFGKLDIFVANLGSGKPENDNLIDVAEIERFYDVNVICNIRVLDKIYPYLKSGSNPNVVFVSSIIAREAASAPCGYAAAKSAVLTLSKYISRLWANDGIRVNTVLPGNIYFEGGRWEELMNVDKEGVDQYIHDNVPMGRFGKPKEIADSILFIASERARFITGAQLVVDGGQSNCI